MKTSLLLASLATTAALATSCDMTTCEKPPQPACTTGTVLGHTCMAGTLVQLRGANVGGQTIQYDADGTGLKTYQNVIATYTDLGTLSERGTTLHFTYRAGGTKPEVNCLAADAPADMKPYTLCNISAAACPGDEVTTQSTK
ncbi:hypothetical protein F0P96_20355 [Hymenobacter busanensis]|uniref:Uncharacterized protein n=1 Tax=Hymenobacter busanensis TaxID=2607656 RepID=A0A7L4ZZT0_9BACT|nr:hypothetical protein [Hymenobacter busanensis]KAA9325355.1 hypothetical protein F0P96_20355 [Hymenobacter busanensis]QHJ07652.1 hypothetical protein GUY19_10280 [Hymenobacter busanensis]